jgi:(1->4)-alpha-D-glucan 1-alpha-D-glucosylmutase
MHPDRVPPASTYRVQLSSSFTLEDLSKQVPYLAELGITDVYLSPINCATPGSTHGYDIVDHATIDTERGGCEGWQKLCQALRAHGLGVVLDVVPNHMAADPVHNRLWRRVLAEGPSSPASRFFDVDWRPLSGLIRDKVMLPVLEEPYGQALLQGRVQLERAGDAIRVRAGGLHLPLAAGSLDSSIDDVTLAEINVDPQRIHAVLEAQHYRLAYWRAANEEINYRRFFDVNELIAIRPEEEDVFAASHRLILRLAADEVVHGLRVDHVDGLLQPMTYLQRLRAAAEQARPSTALATGGPTWIVVEKILGRTETLDSTWPVDGTTGYDALNVLNRLFISGRGVRALRHFYQKLIDDQTGFRDIAYRCKRLVMERTLRSGLTLLAHALKRVADASWTTRDITLNALSAALVEFIACMPVYRTYVGSGSERPMDREAIEEAFAWATRYSRSMDPSALRFLRALLLDPPGADPALSASRLAVVRRFEQYMSGVHAKGIEDTAYYRDNTLLALNEVGGDPGGPSGTPPEFHRFNEERVRRWPAAQTATSTHDTKLGEDARIRIGSLAAFPHEWISSVRSWRTLNSAFRQLTPKGPELDVNDEYRIYQVLVGLWPAADRTGGGPADPSLIERLSARLSAYMQKAVREAQLHSSWIGVNDEYEAVVDGFVRGVLTHDSAAEFRCSLRAMVQRILPLSACHSISQLVLKCLIPGVPDIYQGAESWALVVTDPDNRRPVDFNALRAALARAFPDGTVARELDARSAEFVVSSDLKPFVTAQLLRFRREHREMVARAGYVPIRARGARASAAVAFRRTASWSHLIVAVPRLVDRAAIAAGWPTGLSFWGDTELRVPTRVRRWTNALSGEQVTLERSGRAPLAALTERWPWLVLYGCE